MLARSASDRSAARGVLPRRLHAARRHQRDRLVQENILCQAHDRGVAAVCALELVGRGRIRLGRIPKFLPSARPSDAASALEKAPGNLLKRQL